jgi:hypothetical protein
VAAQLKLQRAQALIDEVSVIVDNWLDGDAFEIEAVTDAATGRNVERVSLRESPPERLALVVGDAVHNMRVALDHAVFEAASRAASAPLTERQERALMFPIHKTRDDFNDAVPRRLRGVPQPVCQVIEDAQPFRWLPPRHANAYRATPLWQLNELDVIDKHRRLTVTAASLRFQALGVPDDFDPQTAFFFQRGPVEHGQPLVSYVGKADGVEHMTERDIALVEPSIDVEHEIMDLLASLQRTVMDVVYRMRIAQPHP